MFWAVGSGDLISVPADLLCGASVHGTIVVVEFLTCLMLPRPESARVGSGPGHSEISVTVYNHVSVSVTRDTSTVITDILYAHPDTHPAPAVCVIVVYCTARAARAFSFWGPRNDT